MNGEVETPYRKSSKKPTPQKADHKHEYIVVFTMNHMRRFNGTLTEKKYKFGLPGYCVDCGHKVAAHKAMRRGGIEIEVDPSEFLRIKKERG